MDCVIKHALSSVLFPWLVLFAFHSVVESKYIVRKGVASLYANIHSH